MIKAFSSHGINIQMDMDLLLPLLKQNGFEALILDEKTVSYPESDMEQILQESKIITPICSAPIIPHASDLDFYDEINRLKKLSQHMMKMGIKCLTTLIFPRSQTLEYDENFLLHVRRYRQILDMLNEYGIQLGIEFIGCKSWDKFYRHPFITTLNSAIDLYTAINKENLALVIDTFHLYASCFPFQLLPETLQNICVCALHLNDARPEVKPANQVDWERYFPEETGLIDCRTFLNCMKTIGYCGPVYIEAVNSSSANMDGKQKIEKAGNCLTRLLD
jgi:sugar phosphate isomerase/epimerase